ncbi:DUF3054 domain-containing protein [Aciditerrimonas ferrireducens]|uniref:DUF3054 domain-containing protein n=1 Tax=Aciditerrimonas ferrireducens TaxID=667306 RepID=UPI0020037B2C|nr:DUF3054 domain-containing protein [Aciditerrimonas ferrireducens]MCK4176461.1 DUF3054 domain-containing protein [Aciditerrimonas ferrireducens]
MASPLSRPGTRALALLLDALLVLLFVVLGRMAHAKGLSLAGVASTAWPFLAGAALGWLVSAAWQDPLSARRTGLPVWLSTVGWGMALRAIGHQGVDAVFLGVAAAFLALFLVGWRVLALLVAAGLDRRSQAVHRSHPVP